MTHPQAAELAITSFTATGCSSNAMADIVSDADHFEVGSNAFKNTEQRSVYYEQLLKNQQQYQVEANDASRWKDWFLSTQETSQISITSQLEGFKVPAHLDACSSEINQSYLVLRNSKVLLWLQSWQGIQTTNQEARQKFVACGNILPISTTSLSTLDDNYEKALINSLKLLQLNTIYDMHTAIYGGSPEFEMVIDEFSNELFYAFNDPRKPLTAIQVDCLETLWACKPKPTKVGKFIMCQKAKASLEQVNSWLSRKMN